MSAIYGLPLAKLQGAVFQGQTKRAAPDESRGADEKPAQLAFRAGESKEEKTYDMTLRQRHANRITGPAWNNPQI